MRACVHNVVHVSACLCVRVSRCACFRVECAALRPRADAESMYRINRVDWTTFSREKPEKGVFKNQCPEMFFFKLPEKLRKSQYMIYTYMFPAPSIASREEGV